MILHLAIIVFTSLLTLFALKLLMGIFFDKRRTSTLVAILSYVLYSVLVHLEFHFIAIHLTNILVPMIAIFIITLNYESAMLKRLAVVGCFYMIRSVLTVIMMFAATYAPSIVMDAGLNIISAAVLIFLVILPLSCFKNIKKNTIDLPVIWLPIIIFPVPGLLLVLLYTLNFTYYLNFANMFVWSAICFMVFFLYDRLSAVYESKLKSALNAQEKEYYFTQCQLMQESVEQMKAFRHDIKSQLTTLKDYSIKGKSEDISTYLDSLLTDIEKSETYSSTGNIAIDSIVNYKLKNIKSSDINLDLKISIPPNLNVEAVDIVTILGNLLDNALDAVAKVDKKIIKLDIAFDKGGLFTKIENSYSGEVKYSEQQILTSKDEDEHGYGLKNIRRSVEKYNGYMKLVHDDNIFSTVVFLYVGDKGMPLSA